MHGLVLHPHSFIHRVKTVMLDLAVPLALRGNMVHVEPMVPKERRDCLGTVGFLVSMVLKVSNFTREEIDLFTF